MAVADVYDALTSRRPYKQALSHSKAIEIIIESSGTHFDPDIVKIFKSIHPIFEQVSKIYTNELEV